MNIDFLSFTNSNSQLVTSLQTPRPIKPNQFELKLNQLNNELEEKSKQIKFYEIELDKVKVENFHLINDLNSLRINIRQIEETYLNEKEEFESRLEEKCELIAQLECTIQTERMQAKEELESFYIQISDKDIQIAELNEMYSVRDEEIEQLKEETKLLKLEINKQTDKLNKINRIQIENESLRENLNKLNIQLDIKQNKIEFERNLRAQEYESSSYEIIELKNSLNSIDFNKKILEKLIQILVEHNENDAIKLNELKSKFNEKSNECHLLKTQLSNEEIFLKQLQADNSSLIKRNEQLQSEQAQIIADLRQELNKSQSLINHLEALLNTNKMQNENLFNQLREITSNKQQSQVMAESATNNNENQMKAELIKCKKELNELNDDYTKKKLLLEQREKREQELLGKILHLDSNIKHFYEKYILYNQKFEELNDRNKIILKENQKLNKKIETLEKRLK